MAARSIAVPLMYITSDWYPWLLLISYGIVWSG
jgi:hypothetical protein